MFSTPIRIAQCLLICQNSLYYIVSTNIALLPHITTLRYFLLVFKIIKNFSASKRNLSFEKAYHQKLAVSTADSTGWEHKLQPTPTLHIPTNQNSSARDEEKIDSAS